MEFLITKQENNSVISFFLGGVRFQRANLHDRSSSLCTGARPEIRLSNPPTVETWVSRAKGRERERWGHWRKASLFTGPARIGPTSRLSAQWSRRGRLPCNWDSSFHTGGEKKKTGPEQPPSTNPPPPPYPPASGSILFYLQKQHKLKKKNNLLFKKK